MYKLEVQDLHKRYGSHEVLKGVSLKAAAGDVISIIGSSGSGKSTFLRCINLLEQPHAGKILLNNEELKLVANKDGALKAADPKQLQRMRSRLSMVFQHFNLWSHMTAMENIMEAPVHVLGMSKTEAREKGRALPEQGRRCSSQRRLPWPHVRRRAAACGDCPCAGDGA